MVGLALQWLQLSGETCGAQGKSNKHQKSPLTWLIISIDCTARPSMVKPARMGSATFFGQPRFNAFQRVSDVVQDITFE
jgi:hypothetical protein